MGKAGHCLKKAGGPGREGGEKGSYHSVGEIADLKAGPATRNARICKKKKKEKTHSDPRESKRLVNEKKRRTRRGCRPEGVE